MASPSTEVICDAVIGDTVTLRNCSQADYQRNEVVDLVHQSGLPDVVDVDVKEATPTFSWTTTDLAGVTSNISVRTGLLVDASDTNPILLSSRARDGASFAGGSSEGQHYFEQGLVVPTQFTAQGTESVTASLMAYAQSLQGGGGAATEPAGALSPVAFQGGTAPTAGTAVRYIWGRTLINGTAYRRGVSCTINPGIQVTPRRDNGLPYPDDFEVEMLESTIDMTFQSKAQLDALLGSGSLELSSFAIEFWPRGNAGAVSATGKITFSYGACYAQRTTESGSGTGPIQPSVTIHGLSALTIS